MAYFGITKDFGNLSGSNPDHGYQITSHRKVWSYGLNIECLHIVKQRVRKVCNYHVNFVVACLGADSAAVVVLGGKFIRPSQMSKERRANSVARRKGVYFHLKS